jgi:AcrR family transcriptional regulator
MALGWKKGGFSPAKKAACIGALARGVTVEEACREARISPTTFYRHEKKDPGFASLCRAARAQSGGTVSLETLAWERGVTGIEEEVVQGGKVVATRRRRSDSVFRMLFEGSDPERFGFQVKAIRAKIEKELRPRIEAEIRAEIAAREKESRLDAEGLFNTLAARLEEIEREKAAAGRAGAGGEAGGAAPEGIEASPGQGEAAPEGVPRKAA